MVIVFAYILEDDGYTVIERRAQWDVLPHKSQSVKYLGQKMMFMQWQHTMSNKMMRCHRREAHGYEHFTQLQYGCRSWSWSEPA